MYDNEQINIIIVCSGYTIIIPLLLICDVVTPKASRNTIIPPCSSNCCLRSSSPLSVGVSGVFELSFMGQLISILLLRYLELSSNGKLDTMNNQVTTI
jgi:hypothetical protein